MTAAPAHSVAPSRVPPRHCRCPTRAVSFFERAGAAHFNSLVVADADGSIVGHYRKSHIPDGPGCEPRLVPAATLGSWLRWHRNSRFGCHLGLLSSPPAPTDQPPPNSLPQTRKSFTLAPGTPGSRCSRRGTQTLVCSSAGTRWGWWGVVLVLTAGACEWVAGCCIALSEQQFSCCCPCDPLQWFPEGARCAALMGAEVRPAAMSHAPCEQQLLWRSWQSPAAIQAPRPMMG